MKKEFWFTLCGGVLLMALFFAPPTGGAVLAANPFSDVKDGDWHAPYILDLVERGIVNGRTKTSFQPTGKITREEFAKMLAEASGADLSPYVGVSPFHDVAKNRWSARHIAWAAQMGIVEGVGGGKFNPQARITRQQIAAMVARYGKTASKTPLPGCSPLWTFGIGSGSPPGRKTASAKFSRPAFSAAIATAAHAAGRRQPGRKRRKFSTSLLWITEEGYVPEETTYREPALDEDGPSPKPIMRFLKNESNGHAVAGVLLDPATVNANVALADHFDIAAHAPLSTFVARHSAKVLANGGYFDSSAFSAGHNRTFLRWCAMAR